MQGFNGTVFRQSAGQEFQRAGSQAGSRRALACRVREAVLGLAGVGLAEAGPKGGAAPGQSRGWGAGTYRSPTFRPGPWRWLFDRRGVAWNSIAPSVRVRLRRLWGTLTRSRTPTAEGPGKSAGLSSSTTSPSSAGSSPPSRRALSLPMDTYLRSVYVSNRGRIDPASERGPWQSSFLRRNTTKEHLQASGGAAAGPGQAGAAASGSEPASTPGPSSRSPPTVNTTGTDMGALARAFEKKRLAIVASLRHRTKLSLVLFCPLLVLVMLFATLVSFSHDSVPRNSEDSMSGMYSAASFVGGHGGHGGVRERFTVMINTYKRHDIAKDAVQHYANCDRVHSIRVVWSENSSVPQECCDKEWFSGKKRVYYDKYETTSLNNRFVPPEGLSTDAVFAVDDDIRVPCSDLDFAYEVWRVADGSLVGFMPRIHTLVEPKLRGGGGSGGAGKEGAGAGGTQGAASAAGAAAGAARASTPLFRYNGWWKVWWDGEYSLVLTKAAFLHRDFLEAYTEAMPSPIREYVDSNRNCEDIAMQFLASNMTGKPPIFVRGHLTDLGVFKGISTKSWTKLGHMKSRGQCLNDFVDLYGGRMPLVKGRIVVGPAGSWWFNQPSTLWEYFSSDLLATSSFPPIRRFKLWQFVPLVFLCVVGIIKLIY